MEPFDLCTKIRKRFKCISRLEDYHDDLGDIFKGYLGVGLHGCEEHASHLILRSLHAISKPDRQ